MRKKLLILAAFGAFATNCYGGASSFGELAGTEPSVRATAMANAYTAADGDIMSLYYNPAQSMPGKAVGAMFERGYAEDSTGLLAFSVPEAAGGFTLAASLLYYTSGDIDLYSRSGAKSTVNGEKDYLGSLNLSRKLGEHLSAGGNIKFMNQKLFDQKSASTFLFDAGLLVKYPWLNIGLAAQNLGGSLDLGSETEYLPSTLRGGLYRDFRLDKHSAAASFDLVKTKNEPAYARLGGEFVYAKLAALRLGYEFKNELSDANQLRFGCGLMLGNWTFDYALVPYKDLGTTQRFALTYKL